MDDVGPNGCLKQRGKNTNDFFKKIKKDTFLTKAA